MKSVGQLYPVIASIVLVLMTIGCGAPAGSVGSGGSAGASGSPGSETTLEQSLLTDPPGGTSGEPVTDPVEASRQPGEIAPGASTGGGFGGGREIDDPFAVIGPAFSGLGFQSYSSGCDPFEDTYGTCL